MDAVSSRRTSNVNQRYHNAAAEGARRTSNVRSAQIEAPGDRYEGTRSRQPEAASESKQNPIAAFFSSIFSGIASFFRAIFGGGSAQAAERPATNETGQPAAPQARRADPSTTRTLPPRPNGRERSVATRQTERAAHGGRPRAVSGSMTPSQISARGTDWGVNHIQQPDGSSCKPTTRKMIESVGGKVGAHRIGNGSATRLDGAMLQRVLTQLSKGPILTGVRSTNDDGSTRGSSSGHVLAIDGYKFIGRNGAEASSRDVQRAIDAAGGDWNQVLPKLAEAGITLRFTTQDPGRRTGAVGATSHLDVNSDGLVQRPSIGNRYVATGNYTVRYFMLD